MEAREHTAACRHVSGKQEVGLAGEGSTSENFTHCERRGKAMVKAIWGHRDNSEPAAKQRDGGGKKSKFRASSSIL